MGTFIKTGGFTYQEALAIASDGWPMRRPGLEWEERQLCFRAGRYEVQTPGRGSGSWRADMGDLTSADWMFCSEEAARKWHEKQGTIFTRDEALKLLDEGWCMRHSSWGKGHWVAKHPWGKGQHPPGPLRRAEPTGVDGVSRHSLIDELPRSSGGWCFVDDATEKAWLRTQQKPDAPSPTEPRSTPVTTTPTTGLTFSQALEHLKAGKRLARAGWRTPDKYVVLKDGRVTHGPIGSPDLSRVYVDLSHTDLLANDWQVVEEPKKPFLLPIGTPVVVKEGASHKLPRPGTVGRVTATNDTNGAHAAFLDGAHCTVELGVDVEVAYFKPLEKGDRVRVVLPPAMLGGAGSVYLWDAHQAFKVGDLLEVQDLDDGQAKGNVYCRRDPDLAGGWIALQCLEAVEPVLLKERK